MANKVYDIEKLKQIYFKQLEYLKAQQKYEKAKNNPNISNNKLEELANIVIEKGCKMLNFASMDYYQQEYGEKYNIDKVKKMLLDNKYYDLYFHGDEKDYSKLIDYSAISLFQHQYLYSYFENMNIPERLLFRFTDETRGVNKPSTIKYFIKQLNKHTGKDYKIVHFNEYIGLNCSNSHLYSEGLLIPNDLMDEFRKIKSIKNIDKFIEAHDEVVAINDTRLESVNIRSMFFPDNVADNTFLFDLDYQEENPRFKMIDKIVKLPREEIMNAVFDTLKYRKQFVENDLHDMKKIFNSVYNNSDYDESEYELTL